MKITFVKPPTGKYGLAYFEGDTADIDEELAKRCLQDGYAVPAKTEKKEAATAATGEKR
jgi:hypothetical protein